MIAGTEARSGGNAQHLAFVDRPGKSRTYVRRVDVAWHSWTVDPRDAHRFESAAAARRLLASWVGRDNVDALGGTAIAVDEIRAYNRRAARARKA